MRKLSCMLRAFKNWILYGVFSGHIYELDKTIRSNIIYTDSDFRLSADENHSADEQLETDAYVEISRCIYCGHKDVSWIRKENYIARM